PTSIQVGILWALDSFSGTSNILPLESTKTLPRPQPPPVAVDTPEAERPPAVFREGPREKTRTRHDKTYNLDPFKAACLSKVQDLVTVATEKLVSMASWSKPKRKSRAQQQHDSYESLYQAELGKKTLPNGILDKAVKIVHGPGVPVTQQLKENVEPRDRQTRQVIWHDIFKSMLHPFWGSRWDGNEEPVLDDPHPHGGMEDYVPYIKEDPEPPDDPGILVDASLDSDDGISANIRTCTTSFNKVLRQEHHEMGMGNLILEKIESAQRAISSVISDVYTFAHMATLIIAGGGAHVPEDGPAPEANFELSRLVPPAFQSSDFQSTLAVAPLTRSVCDSIELNASRSRSLQDDRFKLLNHEHLKRSYTQVIKAASDPETLIDMTDDAHPLWTSIVSDIVATEYSFQPPPNGLSQTTQVHIQQAAKSIENHWSATLYQKSFRYTVLNALRLRLAPERFKKNEQRRIAKAVEKSKAKTDAKEEAEAEAEEDAEQRPEPFSLMRWRGLIKDRFNELGRVVRKHDTDETAMPRVSAILKSLRHLKEKEPQCSDGPPKLIEKISLRQREAQARAEANVPSQQPDQEAHHDKSLGQSTDGSPDDEEEGDFDGLYPNDEDQEQAAVDFDEQFTEGDLQTGQDIDVDDPVEEQEVESSGSQIKRLFTVVNTLVHSPHIHNRVNKGNVKKALLKNMVCTDQELIAARDLVNALLPFTPKRVLTENGHRDPTPHVVLFSPMVTIAQAFLHE
ncbi:hypothetical protein BGX34_005696, partial [Mortierella sp. NVP85]